MSVDQSLSARKHTCQDHAGQGRSACPGDDQGAVGRTARLLELGRTPPRRAVDLLIEDLHHHPDSHHLEDLLTTGPLQSLGPLRECLIGGSADLDALILAKERCKQPPPGPGLRNSLERQAGYFTTIAAALVHHQQRICSRPMEELTPILLDLASAAPQPWSDLYCRATKAG